MAKKDWKKSKLKKNMWCNEKENLDLAIHKAGKEWEVNIDDGRGEWGFLGYYKTKKDAMKKVLKYMETH